MVEQHYINNL